MTDLQKARIKYLAATGYGVRDMMTLTGHSRADVQRVLAAESAGAASDEELAAAARYVLKRRPRGRTAEEHERIVKACFGDVL